MLTANETGLSDAGVWKLQAGDRNWALRRWLDEGLNPDRLRELHRWLLHLRDCGELPVAPPIPSLGGATLVESDGSLWQLESWLPGEADLTLPPPATRISSVMRSLARLHRISARYRPTASGRRWFDTRHGPSPTVRERLDRLAGWTPATVDAVYGRLQQQTHDPSTIAAAAVLRPARDGIAQVVAELRAIEDRQVPLLPCLRDARPDHFLFSGDSVTGIIDPSAARTESVATDLSRLLGGYLPAGVPAWGDALAAYESTRPLTDNERLLLRPLDRSNALLSGLAWVERAVAGTLADAPSKILERMSTLADRLTTMFPQAD